MTIEIVSGGVSSSLTVADGVELRVLSGGYVYNTTVLNGGVEVLSSGALASGETISSGGEAILSSGSLAEGLTVSAGGKLLGAGELGSNGANDIYGSISGAILGDAVTGYGIAYVETGGVASRVVLHDGRLYVSSGAGAFDTVVAFSGGNLGTSYEDVSGLSFSATVTSGGVEYVESGGTSEDAVVSKGGSAVVSSGGLATALIVDNGGTAFISYGGEISNLTISAGGALIDELLVSSGQHLVYGPSLSGVTLAKGGSIQLIDPTLLSGGALTLGSGTIVSAATVSAGGDLLGPGEIGSNTTDYIYGQIRGVALGDAVTGYTIAYLESGGIASGVVLQDARLYVSSGARSYGAVISFGGGNLGESYEDVSGLAIGALVKSGGIEYVESGGTSEDAIVSKGGSALVSSGGLATGLVISSGGSAFIDFGGKLSNITVSAGGTLVDELLVSNGQRLTYGPTLNGVTLVKGGVIDLLDPTLLSGGVLTLESGAIVSGATVSAGGDLVGPGEIGSNSTDTIYGEIKGVALGDALTGYSIAYLSSGGVASGVVLQNGRFYVSSGARAYSTVVSFGGGNLGGSYDDVSGLTIGSLVRSGGVEYVESGGTSEDAIISKGGSALISSGGLATGLVISSGGSAFIDFGGKLSNITVSAGGALLDELLVSNGQRLTYGPTLNGVTLVKGGVIDLLDPTLLSGGALTLASGAIVSGATVSAGGELVGPGEIGSNSTDTIYGEIKGVALGDAVTGYSIAYLSSGGIASGMALENGRLYVSSGARTYSTLVSFGGGNLGGSYDDVSGLAISTLVRSGGVEYVESGGTSEDAIISKGGSAVVSSGGVDTSLVVSSGGTAVVNAGGRVTTVKVVNGGALFDNGEIVAAGAGTLDGTLSGSGVILQTRAGDLVLGDTGSGFSGRVAIELGTVELATASALGSGYLQFVEPATGSAVLQIDAAAAPAAGGIFASKIQNFNGVHDDIDLRSIAYVAGATAKATGGILTLTDGGKTYRFEVSGSLPGGYSAESDGHGGTQIVAAANADVARFAQATALFAPSDAAKTALVSSTSPSGQTPFAHATASAGAGHL
jgi:autotransporter passenger strand-loop-strand repeat protein